MTSCKYVETEAVNLNLTTHGTLESSSGLWWDSCVTVVAVIFRKQGCIAIAYEKNSFRCNVMNAEVTTHCVATMPQSLFSLTSFLPLTDILLPLSLCWDIWLLTYSVEVQYLNQSWSLSHISWWTMFWCRARTAALHFHRPF